jgi:hypothetical protein
VDCRETSFVLGTLLLVSSCGVITKPVKLATELSLKPVKVVSDATIDVLEKPAKKAIQWVKPKNLSSHKTVPRFTVGQAGDWLFVISGYGVLFFLSFAG